jgi:phage terminase small subunit
LSQVDDASAQSIAVAMRSHRAVHLSPPAALMNRWASRRLGLSPVPEEELEAYDDDDDDDDDEYLSYY